MRTPIRALSGVLLAASIAGSAHATLVNIRISGVVDYNVIGGQMGGSAGTPSGTPVVMSFDVDSNDFLNSLSFPTRGYRVIDNSFSMNVGACPVNWVNPQSSPAYFVLRDNDPAVDGFFLSPGVDWPFATEVTIPGLNPVHELNFLRTFSNNTTLTSLNILDAVGTYGFENMSSYQWSIGRFGNNGAEYVPEQIKITAVPEPATMAALGLGALGMIRRSRKSKKA